MNQVVIGKSCIRDIKINMYLCTILSILTNVPLNSDLSIHRGTHRMQKFSATLIAYNIFQEFLKANFFFSYGYIICFTVRIYLYHVYSTKSMSAFNFIYKDIEFNSFYTHKTSTVYVALWLYPSIHIHYTTSVFYVSLWLYSSIHIKLQLSMFFYDGIHVSI